MPILTVWLITYNHEAYIRQAIHSIRSQDFDDYEVIVVDNASTDGTVPILREYAAQDKRVILHTYAENLGCNARYDPVLMEARGKYLVGISGDDWFSDGCFRAGVEAAENYQADLVHWGYTFNYFDDEGKLVKKERRSIGQITAAETPMELSSLMPVIMEQCHMAGEDGLLRRTKWMRENDIRMEKHWEDGPYVADMFAACQRYVAIPANGYEYRAYLNANQGLLRNSSSSSYYVRTSFIKTIPHTYQTYKRIYERTNQPTGRLMEQYAFSLLWMLTSYICNAADKRDIYYRSSRFPATEKVALIREILEMPVVQNLIHDAGFEWLLLQNLSETLCSILEDFFLQQEEKHLEQDDWLLNVVIAYRRLKRTFSYCFDEIFGKYKQAVIHPGNRAGLGTTVLNVLVGAQSGNWAQAPLLDIFRSSRREQKKIAVYGAGFYGQKLVTFLVSLKFSPVCVIDRVKTGEIEGVPIVTLQEFQRADLDTPVTVAVREPNTQKQIQSQLEEMGFKNNLLLSDQLFDVLAECTDMAPLLAYLSEKK